VWGSLAAITASIFSHYFNHRKMSHWGLIVARSAILPLTVAQKVMGKFLSLECCAALLWTSRCRTRRGRHPCSSMEMAASNGRPRGTPASIPPYRRSLSQSPHPLLRSLNSYFFGLFLLTRGWQLEVGDHRVPPGHPPLDPATSSLLRLYNATQ